MIYFVSLGKTLWEKTGIARYAKAGLNQSYTLVSILTNCEFILHPILHISLLGHFVRKELP